jgi:hypothetical protein
MGDLADFGGGREKYDADLLDTAIREYYEECYGCFGQVDRYTLASCPVLLGVDSVEILMESQVHPSAVDSVFHEKAIADPRREVSDIVWLFETDLLYRNQVYRPVIQPLQQWLGQPFL